MKNKIYYVYVLLDPRKRGNFRYKNYKFDFEPFYVGKGKNTRAFDHETLRNGTGKYNSHRKNRIKKLQRENLKPIVVIKKEHLTNLQAIKFEIKLIKSIGRKNLKEGPLTNHTDGGEGTLNTIVSDKTKQKMKDKWTKNRRKIISKLQSNRIKSMTDEEKRLWKQKISKSQKQRLQDRSIIEKSIKTYKKNYKLLSEKDKLERNEINRQAQLKRWSNISEEDRKKLGKKIKEKYKSPKYKKMMGNKIKQGKNKAKKNRTEKERKLLSKKYSDAIKSRYARMTKKEKDAWKKKISEAKRKKK